MPMVQACTTMDLDPTTNTIPFTVHNRNATIVAHMLKDTPIRLSAQHHAQSSLFLSVALCNVQRHHTTRSGLPGRPGVPLTSWTLLRCLCRRLLIRRPCLMLCACGGGCGIHRPISRGTLCLWTSQYRGPTGSSHVSKNVTSSPSPQPITHLVHVGLTFFPPKKSSRGFLKF